MADSLTILVLLRDLQRQVNEVSKLQGPRGIEGPEGKPGPQGAKGEQGPRGLPGADGPIGPTGPAGEDGRDGEDGRGVLSVSMAADGDLVFEMTDGTQEVVEFPTGLLGAADVHTYIVGQGRTIDETSGTGPQFSQQVQNQIDQNTSDVAALETQVTTAIRTTSSADQTLVAGAFTQLDYDTTQYNQNTDVFSVSADGRITVALAGVYTITAGVTIQADALSAIANSSQAIFVNGNIVAINTNETTLEVSGSRGHSVATTIQLAANDVVDTRVFTELVSGVGNGLARRLGILLGQTATQVNHLSITRTG